MTRINLDELLDARARLQAEEARAKGRPLPAVGDEDLPAALLPLIGMWLLLTVVIAITLVSNTLQLIARLFEEMRNGYANRPKPKPRPRATTRRKR